MKTLTERTKEFEAEVLRFKETVKKITKCLQDMKLIQGR